jgi:hypothetical protein
VTNSDGSVSVTLPQASVTVGADGSVLSSTSTDTGNTAETTASATTPYTAASTSTSQAGDASGLATSPILPLLLIGGAALLLMGVMD